MKKTAKKTKSLPRKLANGAALLPLDELKRELMQDPEFRAAYEELGPEFEMIATLIELRNRRGMSQSDLAKAVGTKQPSIARLESPSYGKTSLATLKKIAEALHAQLIVRFEPR